VTGAANSQVDVELFVAFLPGTYDEGAAFIGDDTVSINSGGQGTFLHTFDRDIIFRAQGLNPPGPFPISIGHSNRLVATATALTGSRGTSEFSALSNPTLTGDYNLDGSVDTVDWVIWRDNQNATNALYTQGDGNFDGTVN
jgi:hypothetical protein